MDGVLGRVEIDRTPAPRPQVYSHGRWPVKKLQAGQTIRFYSKNFGREVVMHIEKLYWLERMVIVTGTVVNDVAFQLDETVELVTVEEVAQRAV